MPTIALLPGDHTGGSVDLVDIKAGTPGSSRPSVENHLALMKNTAQGVEEVGKSLRLHDLEQAEGHVVPEEDGTRYDLETGFSSIGEERELLVRQREDGETTKVWSDTWPDEASLEVVKPDGMDVRDLLVEVWGEGGHLEGCSSCTQYWKAHFSAPVREFQTDTFIQVAEGNEESMRWRLVGQATIDLVVDAYEAMGDATVEAAEVAVSEISAHMASLKKDVKSELSIDRDKNDNCNYQSDLDGVQKWNNQSVVHGNCRGEVSLNHTSEDYAMTWEAGSKNPGGSLDDMSVQFKNDTVREGDTTKRDVTIDTTGTLDYEEPSLEYRDEDREYTVPVCMLTGTCS